MTRKPAKEGIDPQWFVTRESCEDKHKSTESSINWIKGFIALVIAMGGGIVGYAINEAKSASMSNGDLEVKLESLMGSETAFKDRVIKSLDETRSAAGTAEAAREKAGSRPPAAEAIPPRHELRGCDRLE